MSRITRTTGHPTIIRERGIMRIRQVLPSIALAALIALGAAQSAVAGLQIELIYIENPRQPAAPLVTGDGQLREIMRVAAENWERVFKRGGGNWKLTIEYGWSELGEASNFGQEFYVSERGNNPSRIGHS